MAAFKLPGSFLKQLAEFTDGYYMVTINSEGEFETFSNFPTPVSAMAILNFLDVESGALQESIRQQAIERETNSDDDEESDSLFD
jgi:hypothetical protein